MAMGLMDPCAQPIEAAPTAVEIPPSGRFARRVRRSKKVQFMESYSDVAECRDVECDCDKQMPNLSDSEDSEDEQSIPHIPDEQLSRDQGIRRAHRLAKERESGRDGKS